MLLGLRNSYTPTVRASIPEKPVQIDPSGLAEFSINGY